jgi:subtilisin family serine protease
MSKLVSRRAKKLISVTVFALVTTVIPAQSPRKKITRAADVPVFQYKINGKVEDLIQSEEAFRPLAVEIRRDVDSVLRDYDVEDAATKRSLLATLLALDVLDKRDDDARAKLAEIKSLEEKPAQKAISGLVTSAILEAHKQTPAGSPQQYRQNVYQALKRSLDGLNYDLVQSDLKSTKAGIEISTRALIIGQIKAAMDPVVEKTGSLSSDLANRLPGVRMVLIERLPVTPVITEALGGYLAAHNVEKKDIWTARSVTLEPGKNYTPVTVAVWDSGVDIPLFKDRLKKDDGKPAVIAYDLENRNTTGSLYPLTLEQKGRYKAAESELKAFSDLQANIDSPEATSLRKTIGSLKPDEVRPFIEEISLFANYSHGTHVAGILLAGNPYARLVTGRLTFDYKIIPNPCPSRELSERAVAASQAYVNFFKRNGVRVVNMSWGGSEKDFEDGLEKCGIGKTTEERQRQARELFELEKTGLRKAFESAPEILFITAAGNANSDSSFSEFIPSSLQLPNLLTVGAVDKAGDEASFTSYGPTVLVHANGYEVESYVPGGDRIKMSGTSMASPNVANLAAKTLAVNPKLTPPQVIEVIRQTTQRTADGRRFLIDPKKAVTIAQEM